MVYLSKSGTEILFKVPKQFLVSFKIFTNRLPNLTLSPTSMTDMKRLAHNNLVQNHPLEFLASFCFDSQNMGTKFVT